MIIQSYLHLPSGGRSKRNPFPPGILKKIFPSFQNKNQDSGGEATLESNSNTNRYEIGTMLLVCRLGVLPHFRIQIQKKRRPWRPGILEFIIYLFNISRVRRYLGAGRKEFQEIPFAGRRQDIRERTSPPRSDLEILSNAKNVSEFLQTRKSARILFHYPEERISRPDAFANIQISWNLIE